MTVVTNNIIYKHLKGVESSYELKIVLVLLNNLVELGLIQKKCT